MFTLSSSYTNHTKQQMSINITLAGMHVFWSRGYEKKCVVPNVESHKIAPQKVLKLGIYLQQLLRKWGTNNICTPTTHVHTVQGDRQNIFMWPNTERWLFMPTPTFNKWTPSKSGWILGHINCELQKLNITWKQRLSF